MPHDVMRFAEQVTARETGAAHEGVVGVRDTSFEIGAGNDHLTFR
jgi:hypothetical protein